MDLEPPPEDGVSAAEMKRIKKRLKRRRQREKKRQQKLQEQKDKEARKQELLQRLRGRAKSRQHVHQMQKWMSMGAPEDVVRKIMKEKGINVPPTT